MYAAPTVCCLLLCRGGIYAARRSCALSPKAAAYNYSGGIVMGNYILSLDQGTTSSRASLFDREQNIMGVSQKEFTQPSRG